MHHTPPAYSEYPSSSDVSTKHKTRIREPETTLKLGCACAVFVFSINLGFLILASTNFRTSSEGITIAFTGSCSKARSISLWSHLVVNILSSLLLVASNNCMQYLTAPSRTEVDEAHRRRLTLDIGVHSLKNFKSISPTRRVLWTCLGLSALPLHLLYNSTLFEVTSASSYAVLAAQLEPETCQVGASLVVLGSVMACNLLQAVCMYWTFARLNHEPLATIGDAIASFLDTPDAITTGFGAMSAEPLEAERTIGSATGYTWKGKRKFAYHAASPRRWVICTILFFLFWVLALLLLVIGNADSDSGTLHFSALAAKGIGRLNTEYLLRFNTGTGFMSDVIIANIPQVCVSLLYLLYNDLYTRICSSKEWSSYSRIRRPLRVREPRVAQRGTFFLSIPWKVSVPLLVTMMILHWLVSQSLFVALVRTSDSGSGASISDSGFSSVGCGWSPFAIVLSLMIEGAMILWLWITGFVIRCGSQMPLARCCSMAISAACHPPSSDVDTSLKPVMYGVIKDQEDQTIGHVSFTSRPVTSLTPGKLYS